MQIHKHLVSSFTRAILVVILICNSELYAQSIKPSLDQNTFKKWLWVSGSMISNDGHYTSYVINNQPQGSKTTVLRSTIGKWEKRLVGISGIFFTDDSQKAIAKSGDSLFLLTLGTDEELYIPNVTSFKLLKSSSNELLVYHLKDSKKQLVVKNLSTNLVTSWDSVSKYWVSSDGKVILTQTEEKKDSSYKYMLKWIDLESGNRKSIYTGEKITNLYFDRTNSQIAFVVESTINKQIYNAIWHYKIGHQSSVLLIDNQSDGMDSDVKIDGLSFPGFNKDGSRVFISLKELDYYNPPLSMVQVNIWHYKDEKLQPQQNNELSPKKYEAVVSIENKKIIRLTKQDEILQTGFTLKNTFEYGLLLNNRVTWMEKWHPARLSTYVVSIKNGNKIFEIKNHFGSVALSPNGKFIVYYDLQLKNYFSYEILTATYRNITRGITLDWLKKDGNRPPFGANFPAAWLEDEGAVFLYDKYDIWQVDLFAKAPPINLTNGYGRKNNISFRFSFSPFKKESFKASQHIIINSFKHSNKYNGFFKIKVGQRSNPELLSMGPYIFNVSDQFVGSEPQKARDADVWIVTRESATESPNYFCTTDFKIFKPLSDIRPEKEYNWLKTELHTWKTSNGQLLQGILYKPENFDSTKKYPILFHIYEKKSDGLNLYSRPKLSPGELDVPFFVSNGYLVFEPDIQYKVGYTGQSAQNSVISAAQYLSKFSFVNSQKMGLQGFSFGGFETNYIVTHSNIFAAACAGAGATDFISYYGNLLGSGESQQLQFEFGQYRIDNNLWQRPELYFNNSPVLKADKVVTPLLIMHTTNDGAVPFSQAVEMFTALRRLQKPAWMLEYNEGNHGVSGKSAEDFTIRMQQFFNHYLKSAPPPIWMSRGIPARLKSITTGYPLDPTGSCSPSCHICLSWNAKMKKDSAACLKEIERRKKEEHWE